MSKTIEDRAAAWWVENAPGRLFSPDQIPPLLAAFAASEVARVRQEAIDACDAVLAGLRNGGARNAAKAVRARIIAASLPLLDDVLRERGLTHVGFIEKGGVVTDVNHKPVKRAAKRLPPWCANPRHSHGPHFRTEECAGLSSLARTVKKRGAR